MTKSFTRNFDLLAMARLIQDIVLWYSILIALAYFLHLSVEQIALSIIATNVGVILFEVTSGVLADRWSRKWTLALGTIMLMISSAVIGLSDGAFQYIVGSFLWGVYFALQSGTSESLIYDMLQKEGKTSLYKKYVARLMFFSTAGLVIGSILGGFVAETVSLRAAFLFSLIPSALSLLFLTAVKEPKEHQQNQNFSSVKHYGVALGYLIKSRSIVLVALLLVLIAAAVSFISGLNQVYYFAAGLPLVLYGVFNASLLFSEGAGYWLAERKSNKLTILVSVFVVLFTAIYILFRLSIFSAVLLSCVYLIFFYLTAIFSHHLQDNIASEVRAAANSIVSTGGRVILSVMLVAFGIINTSEQKVNGFVLLVIVTVPVVFLTILSLRQLPSLRIPPGEDIVPPPPSR